ncbi:MAG: response regulator [Candidatus Synoicihabitans palmerolidicus]|nr:response regulator [Candidatus Synoicihabitans palmerolidicus]
MLKKAGFTVSLAENGLKGLNAAQSTNPDVIVLDIEMPIMDGYETIKALRADPRTASIPVLVASSYAMPGERARARELGVQDYLEKPFDPMEFMRRTIDLLPSAS